MNTSDKKSLEVLWHKGLRSLFHVLGADLLWTCLQSRYWQFLEKRKTRQRRKQIPGDFLKGKWGKVIPIKERYPYLTKTNRSGPTDYLTEFTHEEFEHAKRSAVWSDDWEGATARLMDAIEQLDLIHTGMHILEYGCGVGRVSRAILERHDVTITAVDKSPQMLKHVRSYVPESFRSSGQISLMSDVELFEKLPHLGRSFDLIIFIEVLQHIPEPILDEILPELMRGVKDAVKILVWGEEVLDVDAKGQCHRCKVEDVLKRYMTIERYDIFSLRRHCHICRPAR